MNISLYREEIIDKFADKFKEITEKDFEKFLYENEYNIWPIFKKINEDKDLYLYDFNKKNDKSKKRWITSELDKSTSAFYNDMKTANELYGKLPIDSREELFKEIYHYDNPKELFEKTKEKILKWNTRESYFIDFPYISKKRTSAINPAICNDVILYLLNITNRNDNHVVKIPVILNDISEDTTNKVKMIESSDDIDGIDKTINKQIYFDDDTGEEVSLNVETDKYLSYFSKGGAVTELDIEIRNEIIKQLRVFNSLDRGILQYLLLQTEEIYKADRIERDIDSIALSIYKKNTKPNRDKVIESLYKLGSSGYSKNGRFVGGFFTAKIEPVKEGKRVKDVAHIYIDGMIREIILSNDTFNFYADKFNLLSKDAQKILITLQSERIIRVLNGNQDLYDIKSYSFFRKAIYFTNKRTMKNRILSALDELVKYKMGIKSYKIINKYEVELEYFKFQEKDIKLIKGENFKYGDIIDGSYDIIL